MFQKNSIDLQCQNSEHEKSYIIGSCLYPNCEKIRPFCSACKKEFHGDHLDSLVKFDELDILKNQKIGELQELQNKVEEMKMYIDSIIPILKSYLLNQRDLNQLTISEIQIDSQKILQINSLNQNFKSRIENLALDIMQLKKDLKSNSEMKASRKEVRNLNISIIKDAHFHQTSNSLSPSINEQRREMSQSYCTFKPIENSPSKKQSTQPDEQLSMSTYALPKKSMFSGLKLLQLQVSQYKDKRILVNNNIVSAKEAGGLVLFEPKIEECNLQTFQLKIKNLINNFQSNVYFGICSNEFVKNSSYKPFLKELQHGCFMMDQSGVVVSSHRNSDNFFKKGFTFQAGQTVQIEVKFYTKTITWTNQSTYKSFSMIFDPRYDQYPCALINYASVEMVTQD